MLFSYWCSSDPRGLFSLEKSSDLAICRTECQASSVYLKRRVFDDAPVVQSKSICVSR